MTHPKPTELEERIEKVAYDYHPHEYVSSHEDRVEKIYLKAFQDPLVIALREALLQTIVRMPESDYRALPMIDAVKNFDQALASLKGERK